MLKKLLLADDSLTIQKVVGIVFANLDYQLLIADNGDAALALARKEFPDLILADIGMPGKDGLELCQDIKNDAALSQTPVLLLPGAFENFDEKKATAAGADGWLTKPFESQALINKVEELLAAAPEMSTLTGAGPEPLAVAAAFEPEPAETAAVAESDSFEVPELLGVEESAACEVPAAAEEPISFEAPEAGAAEDVTDFDLPNIAGDEVVSFAAPGPVEEAVNLAPALDEPAVAEDDIWDAVTFEEEDLQAESIPTEVAAEAVEELVAFEEAAPPVEEAAPPVEEAAPLVEEAAPLVEGLELQENSDDEILELGEDEILELDEDDIIELDDDAIIEEITADSVEPLVEESESAEGVAAGAVDFSAPEAILEEEPIVEEEPILAEESFVAAEPALAEEPAVEPAREEFIFEPDPVEEVAEEAFTLSATEDVVGLESGGRVDVAAVEDQLNRLDDSALEELVKKVAGPVVERMAAQLLEQVVWEVVPDLAEAMIKEEIRKIKDGAD